MQESEMKYTFNDSQEESYPVTDHLGENSKNPAKKQEKSGLNPIKHNYNKHNMSVLCKSWKKV